jgi:hypothetical protein
VKHFCHVEKFRFRGVSNRKLKKSGGNCVVDNLKSAEMRLGTSVGQRGPYEDGESRGQESGYLVVIIPVTRLIICEALLP